jgi:hypothetical protein
MQTNVYFKNNLVFQRSNLPSILLGVYKEPLLYFQKIVYVTAFNYHYIQKIK